MLTCDSRRCCTGPGTVSNTCNDKDGATSNTGHAVTVSVVEEIASFGGSESLSVYTFVKLLLNDVSCVAGLHDY
jgi:hypothetical protein